MSSRHHRVHHRTTPRNSASSAAEMSVSTNAPIVAACSPPRHPEGFLSLSMKEITSRHKRVHHPDYVMDSVNDTQTPWIGRGGETEIVYQLANDSEIFTPRTAENTNEKLLDIPNWRTLLYDDLYGPMDEQQEEFKRNYDMNLTLSNAPTSPAADPLPSSLSKAIHRQAAKNSRSSPRKSRK